MEMKLLIVDSDVSIRKELWALLSLQRCFRLEAELNTTEEAVDYLKLHDADVVFINNQPADFSATSEGSFLSFQLFSTRPDTQVIVYGRQKEEAFHAVRGLSSGFLLLPFDPLDLQQAVNRLRYIYQLQAEKKAAENNSLMVKTRNGYQLVRLGDILFLERMLRVCWIVAENGEKTALQGYTMADLERLLGPRGFYRCHQSFLLNLSKVEQIKADNNGKHYAACLKGYAGEVSVSREKYTELVGLLRERFARL